MFKRLLQGASDSFFALVSPSVSGHLGTGKNVWDASDKMGTMFPVPIRTKGEISVGEVASMKINATKMSEQAALWGEYAGAVEEYVSGYAGTVEGQAMVGVAMANARTQIASAEKELGVSVIDAELTIRGAHREMATAQRKLSMPEMLQRAIYE